MDFYGFAPILAIFYSTFHPTEGPRVEVQVPRNSIVPDTESLDQPGALVAFNAVKNYVIPKPPLCNRVVTIKSDAYRVSSYPVHIYSNEYARNSFIFNFAFVFSYESSSGAYDAAIRRIGKMFEALEIQSKLLSARPDIVFIDNIIQQLFQDLNNYSECLVAINDSNAINIKLFPIFPSPPDLRASYVPIATVRLEQMVDENWDPTMEKIVPFINGINSIRRIADLADADYNLTKDCIQQLMYYRCIIIVDLFQFSNIYAPTSDIGDFIEDADMGRECQVYVFSPAGTLGGIMPAPGLNRKRHMSRTSLFSNELSTSFRQRYERQMRDQGHLSIPPLSSSATSALSTSSSSSLSQRSNSFSSSHSMSGTVPSVVQLFKLYKSLHQGQTLGDWYAENQKELLNIDIRRFITFGVIKGIIYRAHSYPILEGITPFNRNRHVQDVTATPRGGRRRVGLGPDQERVKKEEVDSVLAKLVKQPKNFDAISTALQLPKEDVEKVLSSEGEWAIVTA
ncbi:Nitrogen permease regulator 2-like protein [Yarrowia sp. C11]|nr:Nitrogen permease regulator 2-like protein [Yarrowia sp. C11]KAG5364961.1 Nitrogen permease regulator 2-like protein [Yarrowia sp. E02]